jgi:hypothetical protein
MTAAPTKRAAGQGPELLMAHCAPRDDSQQRTPVGDRLRKLIGPDLTRLLLVALTGELHKPARA